MKKVYSKKVGGEVFALAPEQLEVFRNAGYQTPAPEEVIADAGALCSLRRRISGRMWCSTSRRRVRRPGAGVYPQRERI